LLNEAQSKKLIFESAIPIFTKRFKERVKKVGKLPASHRYNRLPLLLSNPGGIRQELVVQDLPGAKVVKIGKPSTEYQFYRKFPDRKLFQTIPFATG